MASMGLLGFSGYRKMRKQVDGPVWTCLVEPSLTETVFENLQCFCNRLLLLRCGWRMMLLPGFPGFPGIGLERCWPANPALLDSSLAVHGLGAGAGPGSDPDRVEVWALVGIGSGLGSGSAEQVPSSGSVMEISGRRLEEELVQSVGPYSSTSISSG